MLQVQLEMLERLVLQVQVPPAPLEQQATLARQALQALQALQEE